MNQLLLLTIIYMCTKVVPQQPLKLLGSRKWPENSIWRSLAIHNLCRSYIIFCSFFDFQPVKRSMNRTDMIKFGVLIRLPKQIWVGVDDSVCSYNWDTKLVISLWVNVVKCHLSVVGFCLAGLFCFMNFKTRFTCEYQVCLPESPT
jgi:hypothetical protein